MVLGEVVTEALLTLFLAFLVVHAFVLFLGLTASLLFLTFLHSESRQEDLSLVRAELQKLGEPLLLDVCEPFVGVGGAQKKILLGVGTVGEAVEQRVRQEGHKLHVVFGSATLRVP